MATKSISIRIEEDMLKKIGFIANYEGRSINSHVLVVMRENIQRFEKRNGEIKGDIKPHSNVKPARKE